MRLLVTRPEADAKRTAASLRQLGHDAVVAPLLSIEPIDAAIEPRPWAAIVVSSANAARAVTAHRYAALRAATVFAVGEHSAQAMRDAGFADVVAAGGDGGDLVRLVAARMQPGPPVLYLAGTERSGDLAGDLGRLGYDVHTAALYRSIAATVLPPAAVDALAAGIGGVLHFSRRSAEAYIAAATAAAMLAGALRPAHFCLSAQVAEPLAQAGAASVRIPLRPTEAALLALIGANPP